jgi:hypothetical protein
MWRPPSSAPTLFSVKGSPLEMSLIVSFPYELLLQTFKFLPNAHSIVRASLVCIRWRDVALENSELWVNIDVYMEDIWHAGVLSQLFRRSKQRPIRLDLSLLWTDEDIHYTRLRHMLEQVVKPHLRRCFSLRVSADDDACWSQIIPVVAGEQLPALRALQLCNYAAEPSGACPYPSPPVDLVFPLPPIHQLRSASLRGISLGDVAVPNLKNLTIGYHLPELVQHGNILANVSELTIEDMSVPLVDYPSNDIVAPSTTLQHLILRDLCATLRASPDTNNQYEDSCLPFFRCLNTSLLRSLVLDHFDFVGRIWDDFLTSLPVSGDKYPLVTELTLRRMELQDMSYDDLEFLFAAFPALMRLILEECHSDTVASVVEILDLCPALCPNVTKLEVDDGFALRNGPVAFRDDSVGY